MRAYVLTSGTLFGLLVLAHMARLFAEGARVLESPMFVVTTLLAAGMTAWAVRVLWPGKSASDSADA